jgi:hypothetical protein
MNRLAVALIVVASRHTLLAQAKPAGDKNLPARATIAAAEEEGAAYPRGPALGHVSAAFAGRPIGTAMRKCVSGPSRRTEQDPLRAAAFWYMPTTIRSGDFVIGGQIGGTTPPSAGRESKIWWVPYNNPHENSTTLLVRGARLDHPGDTIRYAQPDHAWPAGRIWRPATRDGPETEAFFPSGIALPRPGRWLLIATAGDDWGCFILTAA